MDDTCDILNISTEKSIVKEFQNGGTILVNEECVYMSCPIFKFNDYKKKQERSLLITSHAVYNLKDTDIKRRIAM